MSTAPEDLLTELDLDPEKWELAWGRVSEWEDHQGETRRSKRASVVPKNAQGYASVDFK